MSGPISFLHRSSPCGDSVAPVCRDQADSSPLANFSLPENLKGGKEYTLYLEVRKFPNSLHQAEHGGKTTIQLLGN